MIFGKKDKTRIRSLELLLDIIKSNGYAAILISTKEYIKLFENKHIEHHKYLISYLAGTDIAVTHKDDVEAMTLITGEEYEKLMVERLNKCGNGRIALDSFVSYWRRR